MVFAANISLYVFIYVFGNGDILFIIIIILNSIFAKKKKAFIQVVQAHYKGPLWKIYVARYSLHVKTIFELVAFCKNNR